MRAIVLSFALAMAAQAAAAADLFLVGGLVFTANPAQPRAEAVATRNGRIVAVGSSAAIRALAAVTPGARVVDVGGRRIVPGLVEAHGHAAPTLPGRKLDLPGLPWPGPTPEATLSAVARAAQAGDGWLDGEIGPLVVNEPRDWRAALDAASPDDPVMLRPWWGHGMLLNSAALRALEVGDDVSDPLGGWFGRRPDGRLDGRVRESPEWALIRKRARSVDRQVTAGAYRATAALYARWGVTSYHHMLHNQSLAEGLAALEDAHPRIKWTLYGWAAPRSQIADAWAMFEPDLRPPPGVRVAGLKWVLDATPIERDAHLAAPYSDRPDWRGRANYTPDQRQALLRAALGRPEQLAFHVAGDAALAELLTDMEAAAPPQVWATKRVRIEHADGLRPDLLPQVLRLGVVIVANPLHLEPMPEASGAPMMQARLGARAATFQPMRRVVDAGAPLALGSDAGGPAANPYLNMMLAIRNPTNPAENLTVEQALTAYTYGGAYAEGLEAEKGRIAVGLAADLAVLSQDILTASPEALPATRSLLTLVDGRPVHAEGAFAGLD